MKYTLIILLAMFNLAAVASSNAEVIKQSTAANVLSKGHSSGQLLQQVDAGSFTLERTTVEKRTRKTDSQKTVNKAQPQYRAETPVKSSSAFGFSIYEAWSSLDYDFDGDGYYSEFTINFDADFTDGYADVYAKLYLSKAGGPWVLFNTTNTFTIHLEESVDFYTVSTFLNYDFPTDTYDVLIDLYEEGVSGIVASAEPIDFADLNALPLEDDEHEQNSNDTLIDFVTTRLSGDLDLDGFFTKVTIEYDIDTLVSGLIVYAEIDLINVQTFNKRTVSTSNFALGNQTEIIDLLLDGGYSTADYDIDIRIIRNSTGETLANAAQDFSSLTQLPLESAEYDYVEVPPVHSHLSGGGSISWVFALLLPLIYRNKKKH